MIIACEKERGCRRNMQIYREKSQRVDLSVKVEATKQQRGYEFEIVRSRLKSNSLLIYFNECELVTKLKTSIT